MNSLPAPPNRFSTQAVEHAVGPILVRLVDALAAQRRLLELGQTHHEPVVLIAQGLRLLIRSHDIEQCSVFMPEGGQLRCTVGSSLDERPHRPSPLSFPLGEGVMGIAALERQLIGVADTRREPRFLATPPPLSGPTPRSLVCIPLLAEHRLLGVLNVSHSDANAFATWQIQAFSLFGQLLAHLLDYHELRVEGRATQSRRLP